MAMRTLAGGVAVALTLMALATTAAASTADGSVVKDDVVLELDSKGVLHAKESVTYDFGGGTTAGLEREFLTRTRYDDANDRIYRITGLTASIDGAPATVKVDDAGSATKITVGEGKSLKGRHPVVLEYDIAGAITPIPDAEELRWYAVGGWKVPVQQAAVTVTAPGPAQGISCFAGELTSAIGCTAATMEHTGIEAKFEQSKLAPGQFLTIVASYQRGATNAQPILERRFSLSTAFTLNGLTGTALLLLLLLLLGGFALLYWTRGRDARVVSTEAGAGDHVPVTGGSFAPPDDVRPGQIGTLIDEQADAVDVTSTVVDFAVRDYLTIEEQPRQTYDAPDWRLVKNAKAPMGSLLPYEQELYDALFEGRDSVLLSELNLGPRLGRVRDALYDDVVKQGWFTRRPDSVRTRWTTIGIAVAVAGVVATVLLAWFTIYGLLGLALIIAGAGLAVGAQYMPAKTTRGAAVLAHTLGFRDYLFHGTVEDVPEGQRTELFSRYLPYAVVFDNVEHWARVVASISDNGRQSDNLYWYHGPAEWDLSKFAGSMRTFTTSLSGAISATRQFRSLS